MNLKISEVAKLTGVSIRTLHYYDEIGLLHPSQTTKAGYRVYSDEALSALQQILFFRELDFPLSQIKQIICNPQFDPSEALFKQKELLIAKRDRLNGLIALVNSTIKGDATMNFKEFDNTKMETAKKIYAAEVKQRWGATKAYAECEQKTAAYDAAQWQHIGGEADEILQAFAAARTLSPESEQAQALVARWQAYITDHFYHCTPEILQGLGQMYTQDERFLKNIDKNAEGTAAFMAAAIEIYCENQRHA